MHGKIDNMLRNSMDDVLYKKKEERGSILHESRDKHELKEQLRTSFTGKRMLRFFSIAEECFTENMTRDERAIMLDRLLRVFNIAYWYVPTESDEMIDHDWLARVLAEEHNTMTKCCRYVSFGVYDEDMLLEGLTAIDSGRYAEALIESWKLCDPEDCIENEFGLIELDKEAFSNDASTLRFHILDKNISSREFYSKLNDDYDLLRRKLENGEYPSAVKIHSNSWLWAARAERARSLFGDEIADKISIREISLSDIMNLDSDDPEVVENQKSLYTAVINDRKSAYGWIQKGIPPNTGSFTASREQFINKK